ncbi:hypothetical protein [Sodalis sp.]
MHARPGVLLEGSKRFITNYQFSELSNSQWLIELKAAF